MSKIIILSLLGIMQIYSCATPAQRHNFINYRDTQKEFDGLWDSIISLYSTFDFPILTLEKDSGIIVSDWFRMGDKDSASLDCGNPGLAITLGREAKITVTVRRFEGKRKITAKGQYKELRQFDGRQFYATCFSTGVLEKAILSAIENNTE